MTMLGRCDAYGKQEKWLDSGPNVGGEVVVTPPRGLPGACRNGVGINTVRYYEREGLLREPLAQSSHRDDDMSGMKPAATEKLADFEAKLAELEQTCASLQTLVASCPGHDALEQCLILDALAREPT
jgi:hypothetical protein